MEDKKKSGDSLWDSVVQQVKMLLPTEIERNRMDRYFPLMHSPRLEDNCYVIEVGEQIQVEMFAKLYSQLILEALQSGGQNVDEVRFIVSKDITTQQQQPAKYRPAPTTPQRGMPSTMPMHENYTFENFVKGPSNSFAHAAATAVAKGPGRTSYNPLFIYGGTGLGKTHLMEAIVNALQNDAMHAFRERYRKVDLLLLDDVQFIAGKQQIQEEFFNTFNSLLGLRKQVVMTSDVAPKDLKGCEERLTGRFQQGMVVEIESPSYETRLAILKSKALAGQHLIPDDILKFIAENIRSHVRAIEGALNRVVTFVDLNHDIPLSLDIAQHLLKDSIEEEKTIKDLTVDEIMRTVALAYGVKMEEILSKERTQTLVTPRQVAMFLSCKLTTRSLQEIGRSFGKTHATVYHGAQTIQKRIDVESELKKTVENITSQLGRNPSELTK